MPWLAFEAGIAQLGGAAYRYDATQSFTNPSVRRLYTFDADFQTRLLTASALLNLPIGTRFAAGLRVGAAYCETKAEVANSFNTIGILAHGSSESSDSDAGTVPLFGAFVQFNAMPRLSLRMDWQSFQDVGGSGLKTVGYDGTHEVPEFNIDMLSISLLGKF